MNDSSVAYSLNRTTMVDHSIKVRKTLVYLFFFFFFLIATDRQTYRPTDGIVRKAPSSHLILGVLIDPSLLTASVDSKVQAIGLHARLLQTRVGIAWVSWPFSELQAF